MLELRRDAHAALYDYFWTKPPPLVERQLRLRGGRAHVGRPARCCGRSTTTRCARSPPASATPRSSRSPCCLLHAHLHPRHEQRAGAILREELPGVAVSLSSEILREQQEYERTAHDRRQRVRAAADGAGTSATCAPAAQIGRRRALSIMQSSGGVMIGGRCRRRGPSTRSSPARRPGVVAALAPRRALGHANAIAFDMGGTTAKASLIENGRVVAQPRVRGRRRALRRQPAASRQRRADPDPDDRHRRGRRRRRPHRVARRRRRAARRAAERRRRPGPGLLRPRRRGADGHRRERRARLHPDGPLGAAAISTISRGPAERRVGRVADPLGLSTLEAARGVHGLANATMMRALRAVSTEKGRDPRDFALIAYGGSGPVHAAALAAELGVWTRRRAAARRPVLGGGPAGRPRGVARRPLLPASTRAATRSIS